METLKKKCIIERGIKMKNKIFILIAVALIVSVITGMELTRAQDTVCNVNLQLANQDPIPATPGDYVNLVFELSGLSPSCGGYAVELIPDYPFSLDPNASAVQTLDNSPYSSGYKSSWTIPYKVRVADDAIGGDYTLKLLYHQGTSTDFSTYSSEQDFNITVTNVQTDFAVVIQAVSGTQVSLGIVNIGKNAANSLIVSIPSQNGFRTTGTNQQIVGNLAAGDYTISTFNVAQVTTGTGRNTNRTAGGNAAVNFTIPSQQQLQVQIDYTDVIGVRRTVVKTVPFSSVASGNFTAGSASARFGASVRPGISTWWFVGGGVIILIAGFLVYRRNSHKIKNFFKKRKEKNSQKIPDWVEAERTHHKK
jgi:hypothetical protein